MVIAKGYNERMLRKWRKEMKTSIEKAIAAGDARPTASEIFSEKRGRPELINKNRLKDAVSQVALTSSVDFGIELSQSKDTILKKVTEAALVKAAGLTISDRDPQATEADMERINSRTLRRYVKKVNQTRVKDANVQEPG